MSVQYLKSILRKKNIIQKEIEKEQRRRWPNWMRLLKLKKLRLALKDKLRDVAWPNYKSASRGNMQPAMVRTKRASGSK